MPELQKQPRYLDKELEAGTKVVVAGEYGDTSIDPKFGQTQHHFYEIGSGDHVILSGGNLNWKNEQGDLTKGRVYDVIWQGSGVMEKGKFAGKEVKQYDTAIYKKSEVDALLKLHDAELRGPTSVDVPLVDLPSASASESLDELA